MFWKNHKLIAKTTNHHKLNFFWMNYYNDNDKFMAKWINDLIANGLIPEGCVDDRPIQEVEPKDLKGFTQCHFFAGIGGWPIALQIAGWPADEPVWTGSCPCQPLSIAGKQQGEKDERHLWPEFYRLISQCRPIRIFGEQSESPDGIEWLDGVSLDLEEIGYAVGSIDLPSASVGAPNKRQRAWWVAESSSHGRRKGRERNNGGNVGSKSDPNGENGRMAHPPLPKGSRQRQQHIDLPAKTSDRLGNAERPGSSVGELQQRSHGKDLEPSQGQGFIQAGFWDQYRIIGGRDGKSRRIPVESAIFPLAPRIPDRVGLLRGAGNAINPWVAAEFIRAYMMLLINS